MLGEYEDGIYSPCCKSLGRNVLWRLCVEIKKLCKIETK